MKDLLIIKIGGNIIDDENSLHKFLSELSEIKQEFILVHGGGKLATRLSEQLGIETKMVDGRRITGEATLKVITMVYAGWINKTIAAKLNALGKKAAGICGADAELIPSVKRKSDDLDYGFVGDISCEKINITFLNHLLAQNITPVIAPVTADNTGQLLNTNADSIASSLAKALSKMYKVKLIFGFEKEGVLNGTDLIRKINLPEYGELKKKGIVKDGMLPKLDNSFEALQSGVKEVIIGNAVHIQSILQSNAGTSITLS